VRSRGDAISRIGGGLAVLAGLITSTDGLFRSAALDGAGRFSYTFTKPGTYHYFCSIHPRMRADVVVR
jgi:hypothetical protein